MARSKDQHIFHFDKRLNNWIKGRPCPLITCTAFTKDTKLGVVMVLDEYINSFRGNQNTSELLLRTISPHKPVQLGEVYSQVREAMGKAGIKTDIFRAHTTRSASTINTKVLGHYYRMY